ncbi:hypothetical protein JNW90_30700 [Micromonospora sp. STR1s_5]|nr:hypothetical protein [Micromonospora sp. STR1s_5]
MMRRQPIEPAALPTIRPSQLVAMRGRLKMTQKDFASAFALSWASYRDWEQGTSKPDRAAAVLLAVIDHNADAVRQALSRSDARNSTPARVNLTAKAAPVAAAVEKMEAPIKHAMPTSEAMRKTVAATKQAAVAEPKPIADMSAEEIWERLEELKRDLNDLKG